MHTATVTVRLNGDMRHTVEKHGVTPPEIAVLKAIHGEDAVVDIIATGMDKREHLAEMERLRDVYKTQLGLINQMFPGIRPDLPARLDDLGVEYTMGAGFKRGGKKKPAEPTPVGKDTSPVTPEDEAAEAAA